MGSEMCIRDSSKAVTRSTTAKRDQSVLPPTDKATGEVTIQKEDAQDSGPDTKGQKSSAVRGRATSPFRAEASALNRPKLGRLGKHLHREQAKSAGKTVDETLHANSPAQLNIPDKEEEHQDKHMCDTHTSRCNRISTKRDNSIRRSSQRSSSCTAGATTSYDAKP